MCSRGKYFLIQMVLRVFEEVNVFKQPSGFFRGHHICVVNLVCDSGVMVIMHGMHQLLRLSSTTACNPARVKFHCGEQFYGCK